MLAKCKFQGKYEKYVGSKGDECNVRVLYIVGRNWNKLDNMRRMWAVKEMSVMLECCIL